MIKPGIELCFGGSLVQSLLSTMMVFNFVPSVCITISSQFHPNASLFLGYPAAGGPSPYYAPPPAGYPTAGNANYSGYPPQQQQQPAGYAAYPPAMGVAGVPPGMGRPGYAQPAQPGPSAYNNKPPQAFDVEAQQAANFAAAFAEKKVRAAFVRKVFCLVAIQLAITIGIAAIFLFVKPVNEYIAGKEVCRTLSNGTQSCYKTTPAGSWVFYASWALTLVSLIALMCSTTLRKRVPW